MEALFTFLKEFDIYILLINIVLLFAIIVILIINNANLYKLSRKYRKFMRGTKDKNIEELIFELMKTVDNTNERINLVDSRFTEINERLGKCIQKFSIIRYKAFQDMGSAALSFSVALLDSHDDGVILTGIYGRDESTTYAKPIEKGVPKYDLSEEEEYVLKEAMKK